MWNGTEGESSADRLAPPPGPTVTSSSSSPPQPVQSDGDDAASPVCGCVAAAAAAAAAAHQRLSAGASTWCEDEPPSYSSLVAGDPWSSYVFPGLPYEDGAGLGGPGGCSISRPLVSIPLTSYGIFKIEPPRYAAAVRAYPAPRQQLRPVPRFVAESGANVKSSSSSRKYGAILIAATVIVFLMALSLMVRFVTEKSLWKG